MLSDLYHGRPVRQQLPFNTFVEYLREQNWVQGRGYWKDVLAGGEPLLFPSSPRPDQRATTEVECSAPWNRKWKVGRSTLASAAWALTLNRSTRSKYITFGTVVSARKAHMHNITGPAIATVPIRIQVGEETVAQYPTRAHNQAMERVPYEEVTTLSLKTDPMGLKS